MITPGRLPSDLSRLDRETDTYLRTVESLSANALTAPSLADRWSRADVIGHVASNAYALAKLIDWAVTGQKQQLYASKQARDEEVATIAAQPRDQLIATARESAHYFAQQARRLSGLLALEEVDLGTKAIPATSIVSLRISEVVVHHYDLRTAWALEDAEPRSLFNAIEAALYTMDVKNAPGMTLLTTEGDQWVIGDGNQRLKADRVDLLKWLARGDTDNVETDGTLPVLPSW